MMKKFSISLVLLLCAWPAWAQFTQVSGTVTDPNGVPYSNGTIVASLVSSGTPTFTASGLGYVAPAQPTGLSSAGSFIMQLADNTLLSPGGSQWKFLVCSAAGSVQPSFGKGPICFTAGPITISGSSQVITSTLTAAALALTLPISGGGGSGFPVTAAQVVSGNGSISPTSTSTAAQNVGNQLWAPLILPPVVTMSTSGGTMSSTFSVTVALAYVNASGQTGVGMPTWGTTASFGCTSGSFCNITIAAPTLPSGYTGYTVYGNYTGSAGDGINNVLSQASCVNITTSCTLTTLGAGSAPPSVPTAYLTPTSLTNACPPGAVPFIYGPGTNGNYNVAAGWDGSNNNVVSNTGFLTFCQHLYVNDRGTDQPQGDNALLVVDHTAGVGTSASNQDRALWVSNATPAGDSASRYALEGIQAELDFNCNGCIINGSPDGEVSVISAQMADNHVGAIFDPSFGSNGGRFTYFREAGAGSYTSCNYCAGGITTTAQNNSTVSGASNTLFGIRASCSEQSGSPSNIFCAAGLFTPSASFTNNYGIIITDSGSGANNSFNFLSLAGNEEQGHNNLNGKTYLMHIAAANLNPTYAQTNPTCSFASGGGTSPSCAIRAGSTDSLGRMVLTTGTGSPSGTITATVTYHTAFIAPATDTSCLFQVQNNAGTWNALAVSVITAHSLSAVTVQVTNGTTPTALTASTTYDINYECWGN